MKNEKSYLANIQINVLSILLKIKMEVKNNGKINRKFKIILKEINNNNHNEITIIKKNSLDIIYLSYEYYYGKSKRYIKKNIVKGINGILFFRTNYIYNKN